MKDEIGDRCDQGIVIYQAYYLSTFISHELAGVEIQHSPPWLEDECWESDFRQVHSDPHCTGEA